MKKERLYSIFIFLLILSQLFGLYGGFLQLPRVIAILLFPFLLKNTGKIDKSDSPYLRYFFLMITFGVLSILYALDNSIVVKELAYVIVNLIIFTEIVVFSKIIGHKAKEVIIYSYAFFIIATLPIALIEITYNVHFNNAKLGDDAIIGGLGIVKRYAAVTYGNYNLYNHILILGMPFLLTALKLSKKKIYKAVLFASLFIIIFIITINGSRATFVAVSTILFVFFQFFYFKTKKYFLFSTIFTLLLFFVGYTFFFTGDGFNYLISRIESKGFEDSTRTKLIMYGLEMLIQSGGMGVGPGNYSVYIDRLYYQSGVNVPHNLFIELSAQYGIIVFIAFLYLLFHIYQSVFNKKNFILLLSLLSLPMAFVVNSVYLSNPFMWVYFGSLFVLATYLKKEMIND